MIIKVFPDKERVKMILNRTEERIRYISYIDVKEFYSIKAENYYEIIGELITALILLSGFKTTGENAHKELIQLLSKNKMFSEEEISLIDDLRIRRNKFLYEAKPIELVYIENNQEKLKLKKIVNDNLI